MEATSILSLSWEKYDSKKDMIREDKNIFCPEQLWEFNYLLDTIVNAAPHLDLIIVMLAIRKTMRETVAPRPRVHFIQAVSQNIQDRENRWAEIIEESKKMAS